MYTNPKDKRRWSHKLILWSTSTLEKYFDVKLGKEFCPTPSAKCEKYLNDPLHTQCYMQVMVALQNLHATSIHENIK